MRSALIAAGILLLAFSLVAVSGPGRIDIVDGQARFEVAKSIALHGDAIVRNPAVWFSVFPGRDGQPYSYYRLPHSAVGAVAILFSDLTGPNTEPRRHFWFVLTSAAAAACLACVYFWWFKAAGWREGAAVAWALAGVVSTPNWFYGTSTFDDIFAALAVTTAVAFSFLTRSYPGLRWPGCAGTLFGLAFTVKEPLGAFALAGLLAMDRRSDSTVHRLRRALLFALGLAAGISLYVAFELYKFPPGTKAAHAALLERYVRPFPGHFAWGLFVLGLSPCAGLVWYSPAVVLSLYGIRQAVDIIERRVIVALLLSCLVFFGFIASISFTKGDPAWGPRYLTPLYAVLWLIAPAGAKRLRYTTTAALLLLGGVVQLLALSVDPGAIHLRRGFPPALSAFYPVVNFDWRNAQLINRPGEILDIWRARAQPGEQFSWSEPATAQEDLLPWSSAGATVIARYKVLNSFRPWWISHRYMPADQRPVETARAVAGFLVAMLAGTALLAFALRRSAAPVKGAHENPNTS